MKPRAYDIWVRVEVDEDGRITTRCGLQDEEEYASTYGSQDYFTALYSLVPYISVLCQEDPFGLLPKP